VKLTNIMMSPTMFPELNHPANPDMTFDFTGKVTHVSRTEKPPRYFFIDFELSRYYPNRVGPVDEEIVRGGDKSVPEHQGDAVSCDPFPTDIYYVGNTIRKEFVQVSNILPLRAIAV
jgi:hypothetical protein